MASSTLPTAEQVTNMYLYGTMSRPKDMLDEEILDHKTKTSSNEISVAITEYMTDGPGRFVNSANFDVVNKFFNPGNPKEILAAGSYTKTAIFAYLTRIGEGGDGKWGYTVNQIHLGTDDPDYAERTYIWGSTQFQLSDDVIFVVHKDGSREIQNFSIVPRFNEKEDENGNEYKTDEENFDFVGGTYSEDGNKALEAVIDPSYYGECPSFNPNLEILFLDKRLN